MNTEKTVRELAIEIPQATRVFEKFGIDYCCGGSNSLSAACADKGLAIDEVLDAISTEATAEEDRQAGAHDWSSSELAKLVDHIKATHHLYVRQETVRIQQLLAKVAAKHGGNHPEVIRIQETFAGLSEELTSHLMKEENILFPYIVLLERAVLAGSPKPRPMFGTVQNPVHMMELEHASAGEALRSLRENSNNYNPPADACATFQTCYLALRAFETDLHQHIHLENNILFPKAIELENSGPAV
ncbi:MAG TPA: iron-sulfur cluster repair di-iron protein [Terriglobales bacterium]|nr:iron-sulfur cluster repair di-iron protein [Terriglobales bacterium]